MTMKLLAILVYSLIIISLIILLLLLFKTIIIQKEPIFWTIILFLFIFTTITFTSFPSNFIIQRILSFALYLLILLSIYLYKKFSNIKLVKLFIIIILFGNLLLFI